MSQDLETIRRIRAWHEGRPTPRGAVLNRHIGADADVLVVSFVRMGGESRPWGVAVGTLADGPEFVTVPEARNRDLVADMLLKVASPILRHFRHPEWHPDGPGVFEIAPHRQIWLPGPTHLEMLHHLAAAYARTTWDRPDVITLRALGNLCNCLFLEAQRPGQQTVMSATDVLRSAYVFPTSPIRQGHIGHLLGWLTGGRTRDDRRTAAHDAERLSVSTVLDPEHERRELQPLVEAWGAARTAGDHAATTLQTSRIHDIVTEALRHRWDLTREAVSRLRGDGRSPNPGLGELVIDSARSFYSSWGSNALNEAAGERAYWPNVFTDHNARRASAAYHQRNLQADKERFTLVHGDRELQREELAAGRGVIGIVESATTDTWVVNYTYPELTTLESGKRLAIAGMAELGLDILDVDLDERRLTLRPLWKLRKKASPHHLAAGDPGWIDRHLVLLPSQPTHLYRWKVSHAGRDIEYDITSLLVAPRLRHAAFDDDGAVIASAEVGP